MASTESGETRRTALFVDGDYFVVSAGTDPSRPVPLDLLTLIAEHSGNPVDRRFYVSAGLRKAARMPRLVERVETLGYRVIELEARTADARIIMDALDVFHTVDDFALVSGDSGFADLLDRARSLGKRTIVLGFNFSTSRVLIEHADRAVMLSKSGLSTVPPPGPLPRGPQPPKPRRRRRGGRVSTAASQGPSASTSRQSSTPPVPSPSLPPSALPAEPVQPSEPSATPEPAPLRVFLCHSSGDKPKVRELYRRLQGSGHRPWLDEEDILPGQDWDREIRAAVRASHIVLVCLSRASINKAGYLQREIRYALDVALEQPEGTIFLIPSRREECVIPDELGRWQWVNLFEDSGYGKLLLSLEDRRKSEASRGS